LWSNFIEILKSYYSAIGDKKTEALRASAVTLIPCQDSKILDLFPQKKLALEQISTFKEARIHGETAVSYKSYH
jgi:hypothetical protein